MTSGCQDVNDPGTNWPLVLGALKTWLIKLLRRTGLSYWAITLRIRLEEWRRRPAKRRFLAQFIAPGSLCFDVGASVGHLCAVFVDLGARVIALEPDRRCTNRLRRRFRDRRVEVVEAAVSSRPGLAMMHFCQDAPGLNTVSSGYRETSRFNQRFGYAWAPPREVPATTLDDLIERYGLPAFIKIDVEGFELEVLRGLSQPVPCLSYEYNGEVWEAALDCVHRLQNLGMTEFNFAFEEQLLFSTWLSGEELIALLRAQGLAWGDIYARRPA